MAIDRSKVILKKAAEPRNRIHVFLDRHAADDLQWLADRDTHGNRSAWVQKAVAKEMIRVIRAGARARVGK